MKGSLLLSPTSRAMVGASDSIIAIGGGLVSRDEFVSARKNGIPVKFIGAEMSHELALAKAKKANKPAPTVFAGELEIYLNESNLLRTPVQTLSELLEQAGKYDQGAVRRCGKVYFK